MISQVRTAALWGIDGLEVRVEVDISRGLPGFHLVGLPGAEVRESRQRVLSALRNSGCRVPPGRITVNLAPAGVRKEGASFDLAIALGIVQAAARLAPDPGRDRRARALLVGELSLFGQLRPVRGLLAMVLAAAQKGAETVVVPRCQRWEAALVPGVRVIGAENLQEVVAWWTRGRLPADSDPVPAAGRSCDPREKPRVLQRLVVSLAGLPVLRKAALLAAAGGHSLLMIGSPGSGKTRLARLLGRLQPPLDSREALEVTRIHSAAGILKDQALLRERPFRAPHHSITRAGLMGGGGALRPGEVTLAHRGLLFLDEIAEFAPGVLEVLREPLEEGAVSIVRGPGRRVYPARFQLVGAMNPCRCGYLGSGVQPCRCRQGEQARYLSRLSGPLLDRFDIFVQVGPWQGRFLDRGQEAPPAGKGWRENPDWELLQRVRRRRERGQGPGQGDLDPEATACLDRLRLTLGLSLRGVHRCLGLAGTLAALDGRRRIGKSHVLEAVEFRKQLPDPGLTAASG
jgi:magnesium chelatase family protein